MTMKTRKMRLVMVLPLAALVVKVDVTRAPQGA
jgi:hypothetical protein